MTSLLDQNFPTDVIDRYSISDRSLILPGLWLSAEPRELPNDVRVMISCSGLCRLPQVYDHVLKIYTYFEDSDVLPPIELLYDLADAINMFRKTRSVLVHCVAGLNRSGLVMGLALVRSGEYTPIEALNLMREKRYPEVLYNPTFRRFLIDGSHR